MPSCERINLPNGFVIYPETPDILGRYPVWGGALLLCNNGFISIGILSRTYCLPSGTWAERQHWIKCYQSNDSNTLNQSQFSIGCLSRHTNKQTDI